jgi:hypothetical protein
MRAAPFVSALLLIAALPGPADAQVLRGRLLDLDTDEPVVGGVVTLIDSVGTRVLTFVTGDDGAYLLTAPRPGSYLVEARRIGYRMWVDGPILLASDEEWESEFHLRAVPVQLDPVEVTAEAAVYETYLQRVGFYERQRSDFGHFITRQEIELRAPERMTDLLHSVPGVRTLPSTSGLSRSGIGFRGSRLSQGGACHPRVYIDGIVVIRGDARARGLNVQGFPEIASDLEGSDPSLRDEIALDDFLMPEDVQAVEVYRRASEVPARFGGMSTETQCGVIAIWTRRGGQAQP